MPPKKNQSKSPGKGPKVEATQAQKDLLAQKRKREQAAKAAGKGSKSDEIDVNVLEQEFALAVAAGQAEYK